MGNIIQLITVITAFIAAIASLIASWKTKEAITEVKMTLAKHK